MCFRGPMHDQNVQELSLTDIFRGRRRWEKQSTGRDNVVLRMHRVVADPWCGGDAKTDHGVTKLLVRPTGG